MVEYKRIYDTTIKKFLKTKNLVGVIFIFGLFFMLQSQGDIIITGYSGDIVCAGTIDEPCYAYLNFTADTDIFIYPTNDSTWAFNTKPEHLMKDIIMQRSWGTTWRTINLSKGCTGSWCGCYWCTKSNTAKFAYVFRENRNYSLRFTGYKHNIDDTVEWSFGFPQDENDTNSSSYIDPMWSGYSYKDFFVNLNKSKIEGTKGIAVFDIHNPTTVPINLPVTAWTHKFDIFSGAGIENPKFEIIDKDQKYIEKIVPNKICNDVISSVCSVHNITNEILCEEIITEKCAVNGTKLINISMPNGIIIPLKVILLQPNETKTIKLTADIKWSPFTNIEWFTELDILGHKFKSEDWAWWNSSFPKMRQIEVNLSVNKTDYPHKIVITYDSDMNNSFKDLRFTGIYSNCSEDTTQLKDYWIERKVDGTNVTLVVASDYYNTCNGTQLRGYYGDGTAESLSSANDTLGQDIVGYWSMTGNAKDYVLGNNGSVTGATLTADRSGVAANAYYFYGTDDKIDAGTDASLNVTSGSISIVGWIYLNDSTNNQIFVAKRDANTPHSYNFWNLLNNLTFDYYTTTTQRYMTYQNLPSADWTHIAVSFDYGVPATMALYIDGSLISGHWNNGDGSEAKPTRNENIFFGLQEHNSAYDLTGMLDEFYIYDRNITATEVNRLYIEVLPIYSIGAEEEEPAAGNLLSNPGIFIESNSSDQDIEQGSSVNISATANVSGVTVCISGDHGDIGTNYSCGVNTTSFIWNSSSNIRKFNDSTLEKQFNFTAAGSENVTLYAIRNDSDIETAYLTLEGIPIAVISPQYRYVETESSTSCTNDWHATYTCANTYDGDWNTYGHGLSDAAYGNAELQFTCDTCAGDINDSASYITIKTVHTGVATNYSIGTYECKTNPVTLTIVSYSDLLRVKCKQANGTLVQLIYDSDNGTFYESGVHFYDLGTNNYSTDVTLNLGADSSNDFVTWGELRESTIVASDFNDSNTEQSVDYPSSIINSVTIRLSPDTTVTSATFSINGTVNDNYTDVLRTNVFLDDDSNDVDVYAPASVHYDGSDYFYLFGGDCTGNTDICNPTSFDNVFKYTLGGGVDSITNVTSIGWASLHGGAVYKSGTDAGFYVFGGYNETQSAASNNMSHYNPSTNTWTAKTALPDSRYGFNYVLVDDLIYICGGYNKTAYTRICNTYNISADSYSTITALPDWQELGWAEQYSDDTLLFFGGTRGGSAASGGRTYEYNITANSWTDHTYAGISNSPCLNTGASIDNEVYFIGGFYSGGLAEEPDVYKWNDTSNEWYQIQDATTFFTGTDCDEVDEHIVCVGNIGFSFSNQEYSMYVLPRDVSLTVSSYASVSETLTGDIGSTAQSFSDISTEINDQLTSCTLNSDGYCDMPLYLSQFGRGSITALSLDITSDIPTVDLGAYNVTCDTTDCDVKLEVSSSSQGILNISDLNINYLGTSNILFSRNDSDGNSSSITANIYYSDWDYTIVNDYDFIEFIPDTPTSDNVTPYGQTDSNPLLNITTYNMGGKNMEWYFQVNDSDSCVNLTVSNDSSKDNGTQTTSGTWEQFMDNQNYSYNMGLWFWADYDCNLTTWDLWTPEFFYRSCCEGCYCSTGVY